MSPPLIVVTWFAVVVSGKNQTLNRQNTTLIEQQEEISNQASRLEAQIVQAVRQAETEKSLKELAEKLRDDGEESGRKVEEIATKSLPVLLKLSARVNQLGEAEASQPLKKELKGYLDSFLIVASKPIFESQSQEAPQIAQLRTFGAMLRRIGHLSDAQPLLEKAVEIARYRVELKKGTDASRQNLATTLSDLGESVFELNRDSRQVLEIYNEALSIRRAIQTNPVADMDGNTSNHLVTEFFLGEDEARIASVQMKLGDVANAAKHFLASYVIRKQLFDHARTDPDFPKMAQTDRALVEPSITPNFQRTCAAMAETCFRTRRNQEGLAYLQQSLEIATKMAMEAKEPEQILSSNLQIADLLSKTANWEAAMGKPDEARQKYEEATRKLDQLLEANGGDRRVLMLTATNHYRYGAFLVRLGESEAARGHFEKARVARERLAKNEPNDIPRQVGWMRVLARLGDVEKAAEIGRKLAAEYSHDNEVLVDTSAGFCQCAAAAPDKHEEYFNDALAGLRKAVDNGFRDSVYLETEPDFDPLREHPKFAEILKDSGKGDG